MTEPVRTKEWRFLREGVGVCSDGRLLVYEGKDRLILPAPAAAIWEDMQARRTAEAYARIYPGLHKADEFKRESFLICGIEPEDVAS